jgi:hypothetical protein
MTMKYKSPLLFLAIIVMVMASANAFGSVTITIQNNDSPNQGFNDPTPASPVGGNNGTTVGQQRLNAFQFAAGIWGSTLNSTPPIVVNASWAALSCSANSGVLGSAGNATLRSNFTNAPIANTWYGITLANALAGNDLSIGQAEINAQFNMNLGTTGCLQSSPWYYGLDGLEGNGIDLVAVLLHEFSHGLGFQTFTNISNGSQPSGTPSIYDRFLRDNTSGKLWSDMTNAERVASAINTNNLVWTGPQVVANVPNVLGSPRLRVNSPAGIAGNYTIGTAGFGPRPSSPGITNTVAQASPADGCTAMSGSVAGKIAFINRGSCDFVVKVKNAQNAGALAVIIGNVSTSASPSVPPSMGGADSTITIPSVSLALNDADIFRSQLGSNINASIFLDHGSFSGADSSNRALMYAPNPVESGSSVSHFDVTAFPNQLMEPDINSDLTHSVTPPNDLTFSLLRDLGWTGVVSAPTIQLTGSSFTVGEGGTSLNVAVTRSGDTSSAATVDYATSDTAGSNPCNLLTGQASSRCDYLTTLGQLTFAAGETSKTISIPVIDDSYAEGSETLTLTLSNVSGATLGSPATATLTITDNEAANGINPIDNASFFVRQHYIDFLNREPDSSGLAFWTNEITSCGADAQCIEAKRVNVSAAFFLSIEFQETGYLVYRMYKSGFGNLPGAPVPVAFTNFLRDTQAIGKGVQVGVGSWEAQLEANKVAYAQAFVQRTDFLSAFPNSQTAAQFVDQLSANAGAGVVSASERTNLINVLGATPSDVTKRAQVLRSVAEDSDLRSAEFNKAFVLMQYFGYMRRSPNELPDSDFSGFNFWLNKLNQFSGNFVNADMVKSFLVSGEYRQRFGP